MTKDIKTKNEETEKFKENMFRKLASRSSHELSILLKDVSIADIEGIKALIKDVSKSHEVVKVLNEVIENKTITGCS